MKNKISYNNYLPVYLVLILIFSLILLSLPLAGVFGYEYSSITSLLLVLLSAFYIVSLLKKNNFESGNKRAIYKQLLKAYSAFLIIPFLAGVIKSITGLSCSLTDGILFYIFITCPSVIVGASLGAVSISISKKAPLLRVIILLFIIASIPVAEIYFNPQIYFYNPLVGFFPGTIYDEGLSVNLKLIVYRLLNVLFFGSLFLLIIKSLYKENHIPVKFVLSGGLIVAVLFIYLSPLFGYSTSEGRLKSELGGKIETQHFIIHYSKQIDEKLIKVSALHHEYYYRELSAFFNLKPKEKITSFVFGSPKQKGKLFGSENADVAKPWLYQVYTTYNNYNTSLKHEIAHVFSGEFSGGIFKVAGGFNPALIEGIATAADPVYDENRIDYLAAAAYRYGYKVSIINLFNGFSFFGSVSGLSYVYAGTFTKYLIDNYGIEKFKKVYVDPDFKKVYDKTLTSLEKEFYEYLEGINVKGEEHTAHYYFGRKSIFQKVCPRYVADRVNEASEYYYNEEYKEAADIFEELYNLSSSYAPLSGWINSLVKMDSISQADGIINLNIKSFKNTAYYYNLLLTLADISVRLGNFTRADSLYNKILLQNPGRTLFYIAGLRKDLLTWDKLLVKYLEGGELDKYIILREINSARYSYSTFPVLIDLSRLLNENYDIFLRQFRHSIIVNNYSASYAALKLSGYALENLEFEIARRMAALSIRYNAEENFNFILNENFNKTKWFRDNSKKLLDEMKFNE
ncbi:MAG: hypothetical protein R6W90_02865 [Ignavibacteriaceae bacterium]